MRNGTSEGMSEGASEWASTKHPREGIKVPEGAIPRARSTTVIYSHPVDKTRAFRVGNQDRIRLKEQEHR